MHSFDSAVAQHKEFKASLDTSRHIGVPLTLKVGSHHVKTHAIFLNTQIDYPCKISRAHAQDLGLLSSQGSPYVECSKLELKCENTGKLVSYYKTKQSFITVEMTFSNAIVENEKNEKNDNKTITRETTVPVMFLADEPIPAQQPPISKRQIDFAPNYTRDSEEWVNSDVMQALCHTLFFGNSPYAIPSNT